VLTVNTTTKQYAVVGLSVKLYLRDGQADGQSVLPSVRPSLRWSLVDTKHSTIMSYVSREIHKRQCCCSIFYYTLRCHCIYVSCYTRLSLVVSHAERERVTLLFIGRTTHTAADECVPHLQIGHQQQRPLNVTDPGGLPDWAKYRHLGRIL